MYYKSGVLLNFRHSHTSTVQKRNVEEKMLLFHNKHFYLEALVIPHDPDLTHIWLCYLQHHNMVHYTTEDGEEHGQAGEAQQPHATKAPQLPTEEERPQHELTHQPPCDSKRRSSLIS